MSVISERMIDSAPEYYQYSQVYTQVQKAIAAEFETVEVNNYDVKAQHDISTSTWGLRYWEETLGIATVLTDSYEIRRSRVLAKWRSLGNFSAALIESIAEAFTNGDVSVVMDIPDSTVKITFIRERGIPPNLDDLKASIDNVTHAHLDTAYFFTYLVYSELEAWGGTYDDLDAFGLTYDELTTWTPV